MKEYFSPWQTTGGTDWICYRAPLSDGLAATYPHISISRSGKYIAYFFGINKYWDRTFDDIESAISGLDAFLIESGHKVFDDWNEFKRFQCLT